MTYKHLSTEELIWIESYWNSGTTITSISKQLGRSRQTIYRVIKYLEDEKSIQEFYSAYKENKSRCGRRKKTLSPEEKAYVSEKIKDGLTPDVIVGRGEIKLSMSSRTLYIRFQDDPFYDPKDLSMKGKRKTNGKVEKRGKQAFKRSLADRKSEFPNYENEFGHLEGETIVGKDHKSAVITLAERKSKAIIPLKPNGRTAEAVEKRLEMWFSKFPKNLFKSITFDCGKEFSNWKNICNNHDVSIFFADPGSPSQRGLNENSNGLLRRDGLLKGTDFRDLDEADIISVAGHRNNIHRKSLDYKTPPEVFMEYVYSV